MEKTSKRTIDKGYLLFKEGRVKKEVETEKRIHFKVQGETDYHSVIFDKEKHEFSCDCSYSTLKGKECSHILGVKHFLKER